MTQRKCDECGKKYKPRSAKSKYCSRACLWANNGGQNKKDQVWWVDRKGYIIGRIWLPNGEQLVNVRQHRFFMEKHLGRKLLPTEDVHHKDGNRQNNKISNLEVIDHGKHASLTNSNRVYKSGYKLKLTEEQRAKRKVDAVNARKIQLQRFYENKRTNPNNA